MLGREQVKTMSIPSQPSAAQGVHEPEIPKSLDQLLRSKYPGVKQWTYDEHIDVVAAAKAARDRAMTESGSKPLRAKPGDGDRWLFCEDANGKVLSGKEAKGSRTFTAGLIEQMQTKLGADKMPSTWDSRAPANWRAYMERELETKFFWLRLCEDHWKAQHFMVVYYPIWQEKYRKALRKKEKNDSDSLKCEDTIGEPNLTESVETRSSAAPVDEPIISAGIKRSLDTLSMDGPSVKKAKSTVTRRGVDMLYSVFDDPAPGASSATATTPATSSVTLDAQDGPVPSLLGQTALPTLSNLSVTPSEDIQDAPPISPTSLSPYVTPTSLSAPASSAPSLPAPSLPASSLTAPSPPASSLPAPSLPASSLPALSSPAPSLPVTGPQPAAPSASAPRSVVSTPGTSATQAGNSAAISMSTSAVLAPSVAPPGLSGTTTSIALDRSVSAPKPTPLGANEPAPAAPPSGAEPRPLDVNNEQAQPSTSSTKKPRTTGKALFQPTLHTTTKGYCGRKWHQDHEGGTVEEFNAYWNSVRSKDELHTKYKLEAAAEKLAKKSA
ncbi:hypothetical protein PsYK624_083380 [Phanerochaete sordida]|uniref:Uncharacterized protein n=1 Tax=Phanerochaete sordida TaxID=48140 RepID=A0A9P3LEF1_9APHY|nr:hypothetical protein PsYK624_083380 [Phanerochaete sordida]